MELLGPSAAREPVREFVQESPLGPFGLSLKASELLIHPIADLLIYIRKIAVAPDLEQVVGQAHQTPLPLDLRQPAPRK